MLDLVRLSRRDLFPPGGKDLYHQIAVLTEFAAGHEVLVAACGSGTTLEYFVREFGVQGSGVDEDPALIEAAEARARRAEIQDRLQFQTGAMDDLPYRAGVFDVAVAELGLTAHVDPAAAIRELVRVTKPGGRVVLVQLVWKAPVEVERQSVLADHLGARPLMLVELKRILRTAGVERLHTEDWSDQETAFRPTITKPFPDFAELFTVSEKVGILRRAWRRWGWRGVRAALAREREVHRLLTRERILGLDLLAGRKAGAPAEAPVSSQQPLAEGESKGSGGAVPSSEEHVSETSAPHVETRGLPLFVQGEES